MAYIVGTDRYQTRMITTSLDDLPGVRNRLNCLVPILQTPGNIWNRQCQRAKRWYWKPSLEP